MIRNYRVNFGGEDIDYKNNFKDCRQYFPILRELYEDKDEECLTAWHFFEPFVEFTWVDNDTRIEEVNGVVGPRSLHSVLDVLAEHKVEPTLIHRPEDGVIVDWYNKNPQEQVFGYKTYALSAKMAMLFWEYQQAIAKGCGEKNQFMRRPHVLANQIGMNYDKERHALAQRAVLAGMFWDIGDHANAVAAYEKKFGEKYL